MPEGFLTIVSLPSRVAAYLPKITRYRRILLFLSGPAAASRGSQRFSCGVSPRWDPSLQEWMEVAPLMIQGIGGVGAGCQSYY